MKGVNEALYVLWKAGCLHPFRISRIMMLADWKYEERYGERLTEFKYLGTDFGFYVDGLPELLEDTKCIRRKKFMTPEGEKGCLEYICGGEPECEGKDVLNEVIEGTREMSDVELNRLVIRDPRYRKYLSEA